MANAVLTGSQAYGLPTEKSDIDVAVMLSKEDADALVRLAGGAGVETHDDGSFSLHFGRLNLIVCFEEKYFDIWRAKYFDIWRAGTVELKARSPVTRAEAVAVLSPMFEKLRDEAAAASVVDDGAGVLMAGTLEKKTKRESALIEAAVAWAQRTNANLDKPLTHEEKWIIRGVRDAAYAVYCERQYGAVE